MLKTVLMKSGGQAPELEPDPAMGCGLVVSCVEAVPGAANSLVPGGSPVWATPGLVLVELLADALHGDALLPAAIDKTTKKNDNIFF